MNDRYVKSAFFASAVVSVIFSACYRTHIVIPGQEEFELIMKIQTEESQSERTRLISKLESLPVEIYDFSSRWLIMNKVEPFECWTDDGYDPSQSKVPRDIQLLWATSYGVADIENGGFHQFFTNETGIYAPEMLEWFERAEMKDAAAVLRKAMAIFGDSYPRSQTARQEFLKTFDNESQSRADWDPFYILDGEFGAALLHEREEFDNVAERWLRETCGIRDLHQQLPK